MTDQLYRHVKEITLTYQSTNLMQLAIEAAIQGDASFIDRTVLEGLNVRYSNVCYSGMFIQRVLAIQKRSSISVGDFKASGEELYQVHCVVQVECIVIQPQCVFCCSVIETTQSQNNLKRLIVAKGLDQLSMVRVYINLDTSNQQHQNLTITNGLILPCIAVNVKYTDTMISVFATPVLPFTFTYHYVFDTSQSVSDYEPYIQQYSQLIAQTRQSLKECPKEIVAKICSILVKDLKDKDRELMSIVTGKAGTPIEDICSKKPSVLHINALDCLTGIVRESTKSTKEPETHENSAFLLVQVLIKVCRFMVVLLQLSQRYQTVKELSVIQQYLLLPGNEVV